MSFFKRNKKEPDNSVDHIRDSNNISHPENSSQTVGSSAEKNRPRSAPEGGPGDLDPSTYVYRGRDERRADYAGADPSSYVYRPQEETTWSDDPNDSNDHNDHNDSNEPNVPDEFDEPDRPQSYRLAELIRESSRQEQAAPEPSDWAEDPARDQVYHPAGDGEDFETAERRRADYEEMSLEERYEENFDVERKLLLRNIKRVAAIVLAMFIGLMSYLVYFQVARAGDLRTDAGNRRNAEARNKVLRGSIFDRNGKVLSESTLHGDGTQTREYRGGTAFGNILGYVSDKYSITGLELSMDKSLSKGNTLASFFSLDFLTSLLDPEEAVTRKQEGNSLQLTLDTDLQNYAYELLDGKKGSVVALDPKTGEILAMVSSPGFSAARLDEVMKRVNEDKAYAAKAPLINRAINSVFAPGSTMKVVTLASALENLPGLDERTFDDKGVIEFADGTTIRNFNGNVYGKMDLQEAFTNSSNYIFGNLGMELTNSQFKKTAEAFGFNREITMEGLTARKSIFPDLGENEAGNKALSAIGQGEVAATPLQMAMVAAAVANGGRLAQPAIIAKVTDKDNNIVSALGEPSYSQALPAQTARQVGELMAGNVELGGSAYQSLSKVDGAGKTGTGQFTSGTGTRVNAWFVGYAPFNDPQIAIAVCVEDLDDVNENTGARQAIPIAREVMARWLNR